MTVAKSMARKLGATDVRDLLNWTIATFPDEKKYGQFIRWIEDNPKLVWTYRHAGGSAYPIWTIRFR